MVKKAWSKQLVGFLLVIVFGIVFDLVAVGLKGNFEGEEWFIVSSLQRLLFGIVAIILFVKCFDKANWKEVFNFKGFGRGLVAGSGVILLTLYLIVFIAVGASSFKGLTVVVIITHLLCQQIATGFYEEITYRGFLIEGYFSQEKQNTFTRLGYASISFAIFGLVHSVECGSFEQAISRFITTGIMGFAFAAIYLYSHNLLVIMTLHTLYDIPANLIRYVEWNSVPAKIALIFVIKPSFCKVR